MTIVIVVFNRLDLTQKCLASLFEHTDDPDIVVVDNDSTDGTAEWLATQPVEVLRVPANVGWGRGTNAGAAIAKRELLALFNNDTEVHAGWLEPLAAELDDPRVALAAGRLVNPDGSLQHAGIQLVFDSQGTLVAENVQTEQPAHDPAAVSLAAGLVRADVFRQAGQIDPAYRNGYEDVDFSLTLRQDGWRIRFTPDSTVMHHQHGSGPERWTHVQDNIRELQHWSEWVREHG